MILHIIDDEKFLSSTILLFEKMYSKNNVFLVGLNKNNGYNDYDKLKDTTQIYFIKIDTFEYEKKYLDLCDNVDLILFHNIYKLYKLRLLEAYPIKVKKAWVLWGAEIYGLNPFYNPLLPETKAIFYRSLPFLIYIKKFFLSRLKKYYYWKMFLKILEKDIINYTLTNISEDIDVLESYLDNKVRRGWFTYYVFNEDFKDNLNIEKKDVLVGNSSSETNNHLDILNVISKKDIEGKKIYIPLNYGDNRYKNLIIKKAYEIFKRQSYPITQFLNLKEYTSIINSCAIVIMNHKRQQGFNTIMMALANGCKVFLREENTIFTMLRREGFIVFSIQNDIYKEDAFITLSKQNQKYNLDLIMKRYSQETVISRMKNEFDYILNGSN